MTRQKRRIFALLLALIFIAFLFMMPLAHHYPLVFFLISALALLSMFLLQRRLKLSLGNLWQQKDVDLDERQQIVKNQVYRTSYRIMTIASIIVVLTGSIILRNAVAESPERAFNLLLWFTIGFTVLQALLPQFLMAWLEPDDINAESITAKEAL